ncbi:UPF0246 protein CE1889 [Arthrobacter sp. Hiyo4]|nr:UPF0246 protein CE1889 [Arthrobacter sp. Hiyo4]
MVSYTTVSPLPADFRHRKTQAVCSLWHWPAGYPEWRYPPPCPAEPGRSSSHLRDARPPGQPIRSPVYRRKGAPPSPVGSYGADSASPSEGKTPAVRGSAVDWPSLSFPDLNTYRAKVLKSLGTVSAHEDALALLGVGASLQDDVERNTRLHAEPAALRTRSIRAFCTTPSATER